MSNIQILMSNKHEYILSSQVILMSQENLVNLDNHELLDHYLRI